MRGVVLTQTRTQPQAQTQSAPAPQTHKQFIVCMPVCVPSCLGPRAVAAELANLAPSCWGHVPYEHLLCAGTCGQILWR